MRAVLIALAMAASADASSYPVIAGYKAGSDVFKHNRIDLSAEAMIAFLNNKYPRGCGIGHNSVNEPHDSCKASGTTLDFDITDDTDTYALQTVERFKLARTMYSSGGGKSSDWVKYASDNTGTGLAKMANSPGSYTCKQETTSGGVAASINLGKLAHKSATAANYDGDVKVYLDHSTWATKQCGQIPFASDGTTGQVWNFKEATGLSDASLSTYAASDATQGSYVDRSIYKAADCPSGVTGDVGTGVTIECTSPATATASAQTLAFAVADGASPKYGSRTLKGFSTAVEAKMVKATKPEPEAVNAKFYHGTGSYADTTIQAALQALVNQNTNEDATTSGAAAGFGFSTCTQDETVAYDDCTAGAGYHWVGDEDTGKCYATEKAACEASNDGADPPTAGVWTQGNMLCKDKVTHKLVALGSTEWDGTDIADDKADCEAYDGAGTGVVTDFQTYYAKIEDDMEGRMLIEVVQKLSIYGNAWLYTVHEFEDAIADCVADAIGDNDAGVHAWDEGVAFWTGSIAGKSTIADGIHVDDQGDSKGVLIYSLANKRCENYYTCEGNDDEGNSIVNIKLFEKFTFGKNAIHASDCGSATVALRKTIIPQMTVPLIQGTLRYAYKIGQQWDATSKSWAEGYAFMMSVIHRVGACSLVDANKIYAALDINDDMVLGTLGGGYTYYDVKTAFEKNYPCMGISCADVGSLYSGGEILTGTQACTDPVGDGSGGTGTNTETEKEVLPTWAIIAIAATGFLMVLFFGMVCAYKSSRDVTIKMYNDLKKEGARV